jgi:hypothetical protein
MSIKRVRTPSPHYTCLWRKCAHLHHTTHVYEESAHTFTTLHMSIDVQKNNTDGWLFSKQSFRMIDAVVVMRIPALVYQRAGGRWRRLGPAAWSSAHPARITLCKFQNKRLCRSNRKRKPESGIYIFFLILIPNHCHYHHCACHDFTPPHHGLVYQNTQRYWLVHSDWLSSIDWYIQIGCQVLTGTFRLAVKYWLVHSDWLSSMPTWFWPAHSDWLCKHILKELTGHTCAHSW